MFDRLTQDLNAAFAKVKTLTAKVEAGAKLVKVIKEDVLPAMDKLRAAVEEFEKLTGYNETSALSTPLTPETFSESLRFHGKPPEDDKS